MWPEGRLVETVQKRWQNWPLWQTVIQDSFEACLIVQLHLKAPKQESSVSFLRQWTILLSFIISPRFQTVSYAANKSRKTTPRFNPFSKSSSMLVRGRTWSQQLLFFCYTLTIRYYQSVISCCYDWSHIVRCFNGQWSSEWRTRSSQAQEPVL